MCVCALLKAPARAGMVMTKKKQRQFTKWSRLLLLSCVVLSSGISQTQKKSKYVCDETQPESMCNADNTCGSASSTCTINVTRSGYSANVKPRIPNAKNNRFLHQGWDNR